MLSQTAKSQEFKGATGKFARFTSDGKTLAVFETGPIQLFDVVTGKELGVYGSDKIPQTWISISANGKILACALNEKNSSSLRVWDRDAKKEVILAKLPFRVQAVTVSPDGKLLAAGQIGGGTKSAARVWNLSTKKVVLTVPGEITAIAFSPNSKLLAVNALGALGGGKSVIRIYSTAGKLMTTLPDSTHFYKEMCFSPDGKRFAAASSDLVATQPHVVQTWRLDKLQSLHTFTVKGGAKQVFFAEDGNLVALVPAPNSSLLRRYDLVTGKETDVRVPTAYPPVTISPNGRSVAAYDRKNARFLLVEIPKD